MVGEDGFEKYISMLPIGWEKLLSSGLSWYLKKQDPDWVDLETYTNGYEVRVKTDEESAKEFVRFWNESVRPKLGDLDE